MRLLICGSRGWADDWPIRLTLETHEPTVVIHGDCRGADRIAGEVAAEMGIEVLGFPADWDRHAKGAGPERNQQMLDEGKPDRVVAFHDDLKNSEGTADMVRRAQQAGLPVETVYTATGPFLEEHGETCCYAWKCRIDRSKPS